ncbi:MAG TPA: hypothetical protein VLE99_00325 [Candidatus Saccharimonadales bacterium]|nr:hypothetical protein [Candidatus Saccharimonadales bacterium]
MDPLGNQFEDEAPDELNQLWHNPGDPDGVFAAEQRRREQSARTAVAALPRPRVFRRRWPVVIVSLLLVAAGMAAAYWLGTRHTAPAVPSKTAAAQPQPQQVATAVQRYTSTLYTLSFNHPGNWVVSDTAAKLTVTSPPIKLTDLRGPTVGRVVVTIQNQQTSVAGYPADGAMANLASQQLTYAQPSSVQRAQTYVSYIGYKSPNGLDALFLTGDTAYQAGQHVPLSNVTKGNPLVSVTFTRCVSTDCSKTQATTLLARSWGKAAFNTPVIDLLRSLTLN